MRFSTDDNCISDPIALVDLLSHEITFNKS